MGIVSTIGTLVSPILMSHFGRQKTHLLTTFPALLGWICFAVADSIPLFLIARVLHGLAIGLRFPLAAILVAEYTDPKTRGAFLGTFAVSLGLGILLSHIWGGLMSWRMTAVTCGSLPLIAMVVIFLSPESPSWLVAKGRFEDGRKAFQWLRGDGVEQEAEMEAMIAAQKSVLEERRRKMDDGMKSSFKAYVGSWIKSLKHFGKILKKKEFYRPLIVAATMFVAFEFCGSHMFPAYGHVILQAVLDKKNPKDVQWQVAYLDVLRTGCAFVATYLLKRFTRRAILFTSGLMTIASLIFISVFIYLRTAGVLTNVTLLESLGLGLIIFNTFAYCIGLIPLTWVICGEIFPFTYRSLGSTVSATFWMPCFVLTMKTAPHMFSSMGVEGANFVYAATIAVCMVIMYFLLPETKNRTLQEIEDNFKGKKISRNDAEVEMRLMDKDEGVVVK